MSSCVTGRACQRLEQARPTRRAASWSAFRCGVVRCPDAGLRDGARVCPQPQVVSVKGIFWTAVAQEQSFNYVFATPPVAVPALPYHALAPARPRRQAQPMPALVPCARLGRPQALCIAPCRRLAARGEQVAASSGKALWRAAPSRNTTFDLLLCLARGVWMEAAVSMYRSGRLAWCAGRPGYCCGCTRAASRQRMRPLQGGKGRRRGSMTLLPQHAPEVQAHCDKHMA